MIMKLSQQFWVLEKIEMYQDPFLGPGIDVENALLHQDCNFASNFLLAPNS